MDDDLGPHLEALFEEDFVAAHAGTTAFMLS
jgi:hypothetical protein